MLTKELFCLDIKNGRTVKGVHFLNLRDAGDPVMLAKHYAEVGADELVFLDISATIEGRKTMRDMVLKVAEQVNIPFTVGGGISSVNDVDVMLKSGADKIAINSSAVKRPALINELSQKFGSQCVVVAIDAKQIEGKWLVYLAGGSIPTELDLFEWALEVEKRGAGEILFTSMDHDGTKSGFAMKLWQNFQICYISPSLLLEVLVKLSILLRCLSVGNRMQLWQLVFFTLVKFPFQR